MTSGAAVAAASGQHKKSKPAADGDDSLLMDFAPGKTLAAEELASVKVG